MADARVVVNSSTLLPVWRPLGAIVIRELEMDYHLDPEVYSSG